MTKDMFALVGKPGITLVIASRPPAYAPMPTTMVRVGCVSDPDGLDLPFFF